MCEKSVATFAARIKIHTVGPPCQSSCAVSSYHRQKIHLSSICLYVKTWIRTFAPPRLLSQGSQRPGNASSKYTFYDSFITEDSCSISHIIYRHAAAAVFFSLWCNSLMRVRSAPFLRFLDHSQWHTTFGRAALDEGSARRRDLYPTTHNTLKGKASMTPEEFEPAIPASERPQTLALDRSATRNGVLAILASLNNRRHDLLHYFVLKLWHRPWEQRAFMLQTKSLPTCRNSTRA